MAIGYEFLIATLGLRVSGIQLPCQVDRRVNSSILDATGLRVPANMAIDSDNPVQHLEFALKHQGIQLDIVQAACSRIAPERVQAALQRTPNGKYLRQIGFLYEQFTGSSLVFPALTVQYVPLFDPACYVTGPSRRNGKFRVDQNGLGTLNFCPTIRRTPELQSLLERDLFADLNAFIEEIGGPKNLDRALGWAYLSETRSTFDIEGEAPSGDKAKRFVQLLHQAHEAQELSEEFLGDIQSMLVQNPLVQELAYRRNQNWLQRGSHQLRASDVTFLPPPPSQINQLMADLLTFANEPYPSDSRQALLKSLLVSFGFVFNHPFNDGNGRISRFLIHHGLCRAGLLSQGMILPISVAFNHHESDYLSALESVSKPLRDLWQIHRISSESIDAQLLASGDPYRYWDATQIVEFGLRMAHYALDHTLVQEYHFLENFDWVYKQLNAELDLPSKDLTNLIRMAISERGVLSNNRRKQFARVATSQMCDQIEQVVRDTFFSAPESANIQQEFP